MIISFYNDHHVGPYTGLSQPSMLRLHGLHSSSHYHVGLTQYVFNHTTQNDPVAPDGIGRSILLSLYYPTLRDSKVSRPYLDRGTAQVFETAWSYPNGTLSTLTADVQWQAPTLPGSVGSSSYPTLIFGPGGGGPSSICYTALLSELASHEYTVLALDHPYEQPFLQYPYGGPGITGLAANLTWSLDFANKVYDMRLANIAAVLQFYPSLITKLRAPFNITYYSVFGHLLGGVVALSLVLNNLSSLVIAGLNMDGLLFRNLVQNSSITNAKCPVM
jgi:hypothetical protein